MGVGVGVGGVIVSASAFLSLTRRWATGTERPPR